MADVAVSNYSALSNSGDNEVTQGANSIMSA